MHLEFECPSCQAKMMAEQVAASFDVTCPACGTTFHLDSTELAMPTVKPRLAGAPPKPAAPPAPAAPVPPRPSMTASRPSLHSADSEDRGAKMIIGSLIALAVVVLGLILFVVNRPGKPAAADPATEKTDPKELVEKKAAALLDNLAKREASDAEEGLGSEEEMRRYLAAKHAQRRADHAQYLANEHFAGDIDAGYALLVEMEAVNQQIDALFHDTITGNEPGTEAELRSLRDRLLLDRMRKHPLFRDSIAGLDPEKVPGWAASKSDKENPNSPAALLGKYRTFGSGFLISSKGWLITNNHVVGDSTSVDVRTSDGEVHQATVVGTDDEKDLALLKVDAGSLGWLPVSGGLKELGLGRSVFTIGFPNPMLQGVEPKYTDGRVSSAAGMADNKDYYQLSIPVQPGNSGGPLVDMESGWVVGVITLRLDHTPDGRSVENVSYALKCSLVHGFLDEWPQVKTDMGAEAPARPADSEAVINRVREAAVQILVPK